MKRIQINGPKGIVAELSASIALELSKPSPDADKVISMRKGMLAALRLCTVEVRNDTNAGERWA